VLPDLYKLMDSAHSAQDGPIYGYMSGYLGVVAGMQLSPTKQSCTKMTISRPGGFADHSLIPVLRASIDRYKFPDRSIIADEDVGIFALEFSGPARNK
jgi:hypothetical protein